jgi:protein lifeguard
MCETVMVAGITADLEPDSVLISIGACVLITGSLFASALFTTLNERLARNMCFGVIFAMVMQLVFYCGMLVFGFNSSIMALYAVGGVFATGIYILIDLLQIVTPEMISHDDYIMGALMLYLDMVRMFLYLLELFGKMKD